MQPMLAFCLSKMISKPQRLHLKSWISAHSILSSLVPLIPWALPSPTYQTPLHATTYFAALSHHSPPQNNVIFLCFNRQYTSYTSNLITSFYPTLALIYPEIQKTEVWITPNQHTSTSTISEILASSNSHLQTVMIFNPYNNGNVHQTPIPDSDLPPTRHPYPKQHPKQHPKGKPNPSPRPQASTSPQPDQNSWTMGPHIQPNNQPTISSITTGSTFTDTAGNQLLLSLQAKVATLSLRLGPDNPPTNQALLTAVTALLNQSLSHLPALIEQHIHAILQSPSFSAAVTTSIRTELLSLQPPCSRTSQESGSESE